VSSSLKQSILHEARRLGFILAGVTTPDPPAHLTAFEAWLAQGRHANMHYLSDERARARRADPRTILPRCKSILILAVPYDSPAAAASASKPHTATGLVAAYAKGDDYHDVLPPRLEALVRFIEQQAGHPVANRWYTDTGPVLERDLAQRAGLGWIGKNTCLINPRLGSCFLLAEIFLDLELEPDPPFTTDHCGNCTRCIDACPTDCILPDRTLDAGRCISYLTIELKDGIPQDLRPLLGKWIFGCDVCQSVCPWNRFAPIEGDPAFADRSGFSNPPLTSELQVTAGEFNRRFKHSPIRRAKRRGYIRNVAVAIGNTGAARDRQALEKALDDPDPLVQEHVQWALGQITTRQS
jgi:epoxyqueuosine reductase